MGHRRAWIAALWLVGCAQGSPEPPSATPSPTPEVLRAAPPASAPRAPQAALTPAPTIDALPAPGSVAVTAEGLQNGDFVPELDLPDLLGDRRYLLSEHVGPRAAEGNRAAIIGFVASWCGPCRASLPTLAELKREHGDDLQIVLLAADNDHAGRLKEAEHVRAAGLDGVVLDPTKEVLAAYRGGKSNVPKFYIVNRAGEVLVQDSGFGAKVKPLLPKQVRYALSHPDYVPRPKRSPRRRAPNTVPSSL